MERVPECECGTETIWLVVDMDYDTKHFTGYCIAECRTKDNAAAIANALNVTTRIANS